MTVETDPDTGEVELPGYLAVDDCGQQLDPVIVEGQVHDATAQGLDQAPFEADTIAAPPAVVNGSPTPGTGWP